MPGDIHPTSVELPQDVTAAINGAFAALFSAAVAQAKAELAAAVPADPPAAREPVGGVPTARDGGRPKVMIDFDPRERICFTIKQAGAATSVSERTIWNRIQDGELWTFKWGGRTLILADVLKEAVALAASTQAPKRS